MFSGIQDVMPKLTVNFAVLPIITAEFRLNVLQFATTGLGYRLRGSRSVLRTALKPGQVCRLIKFRRVITSATALALSLFIAKAFIYHSAYRYRQPLLHFVIALPTQGLQPCRSPPIVVG